MAEFSFVIKSLILSMLLVLGMQYKVNNVKIETKIYEWLNSSTTTKYLQQVADGAVLFLKNSFYDSKKYITENLSDNNEVQKASRLNIQLKRQQENNK